MQEQARGISISRNGGSTWFTPYEDRSFHKYRYVACDANCATIAVTEYVPLPCVPKLSGMQEAFNGMGKEGAARGD